MKQIGVFVTGSRRGYVRVAERGKETPLMVIPTSLKGLRGNMRKALEYFQSKGATHYTIASYPGVPSKGYSNQYCFDVYRAYK